MNKHLAVSLSLSLATMVATSGCGLLKKKPAPTDDEPSASSTPTITVGGTGAKNEKDVLRYANETPLGDVAATIAKDGTKAKTFPATGGDVATLAKGATVVQKAKFFSTGVLVLFDDPTTNDGTKLLGWIAPEAIGTAPVATTPTAVATGAKPIVAVADAGKPVDAGADAAKATVDAGTDGPRLATGPNIAPVTKDNKCPVGLSIFTTPRLCRRACTKDTDCPAASFCTVAFEGRKTCGPR